jgi:hypothetical protein
LWGNFGIVLDRRGLWGRVRWPWRAAAANDIVIHIFYHLSDYLCVVELLAFGGVRGLNLYAHS